MSRTDFSWFQREPLKFGCIWSPDSNKICIFSLDWPLRHSYSLGDPENRADPDQIHVCHKCGKSQMEEFICINRLQMFSCKGI